MAHRNLIALIAAAAIAAGLAVASSLGGGAGMSDPLAGKAVFPDLASHLPDIERVTLVRSGQQTTLKRDGDHWSVEEKGGYPADVERVRHLLLGLAGLRYVEPKTREERFYPRLEVEDAGGKDAKSTLVTVADAKGALLAEVVAGKRKYDALGGGDDGIYLRKPGEAQSWLARGSLDLADDTAAWLDKKLLDLPAAQIKEAVFTAPDGSKVTLVRARPDAKFALAELPKGRALKADDVLDQPPSALAALELTDVRPAKDFVFPKDGMSHARFITFDGLTVSLDIAAQNNTNWVRISASGTKEGEALSARTAPWLYALLPYKTALLMTRLEGLLAPAKPVTKPK